LPADPFEDCVCGAAWLDTGQADVFGFDLHGREWKVVVSIGRRWAKTLSRKEIAEAIAKQ
jgi:hypothetical protein